MALGDAPVADRSDAFAVALGALRRKERSAAELTTWLERHGYGPDEVRRAVEGLVEVGELDDEQFARRYAEDKRELRGWGPERIREALAHRGVSAPLVEAALAHDTESAQVDRASALLAGRDQRLAEEADRARALGFLTRRGYDYDVAHEAIRRASRNSA